MSGDYSRKSFDALNDFAGVFMQQGHALLDADWNELVAIFERRLRAETVDVMGRAVVPLETPHGFEIDAGLSGGKQHLTIGRGRMYVDGLLAENHGAAQWPGTPADPALQPPVFDRGRELDGREVGVLDELTSPAAGDFVDYLKQPYYPDPDPLPDGSGPHLVYLDVWKREVTPLQDPRLLEPALDGIDTTTRWQTVWQVKVLADVGEGVTCTTPDAEIEGWPELKAPSAGRLSSDTIEVEDPDEPCLIPPGGGYRGLENQLYRVEIHQGGDLSEARFKWSRENASVAAAVDTIAPGNRITVRRIGRDSVLRFNRGDWVEVTDDIRELHGLPGDLLRIDDIKDDTRTIELSDALSADLVPSGTGQDTLDGRHTRMIRWDQRGEVRLADGSLWTDLDSDTSDGLIPVPTDGSQVVLEAGIVVGFALDPTDGVFRPLDHWCFAARTAGAWLERLENAPPRGVQHHYARLAVVTYPETADDCRTFWPPAPEVVAGESCACSVCVTAAGHNDGTLTIQAAVDQVAETGGTVCLGVGTYILGEKPVVLDGTQSVRLLGQGTQTVLAYQGPGGAITVRQCSDIRIEDLGFIVAPADASAAEALPCSAIHLRHCTGVALRRLFGLVLASAKEASQGIALDGYQYGLKIEESLFLAPFAIGNQASVGLTDEPGYLLLMEARVHDNVLLGQRRAISLDGVVLHLGATRIAENLLLGTMEGGVVLTGAAPKGTSIAVEANTVLVGGAGNGVEISMPTARIQDNEIAGAEGSEGSGIALVEGVLPEPSFDAQIIGNEIHDLGAAGIHIDASLNAVMIKRNVIRACKLGAIVMTPEATVESLGIENNKIENIARNFDASDLPIAAVRISRVGNVQIADNTIRDVASFGQAARYFAGLDIIAVGMLGVRGNTISEIGPGTPDGPSVAIRIVAALYAIDVANNMIVGGGEAQSTTTVPWSALMIRSIQSDVGAVDEAVSFPAFASDGKTNFVLSNYDVSVLGPVIEDQITIESNHIVDGHNGPQPLVRIKGQMIPGTSCIFASNQCRLLSNEIVGTVVTLAAPRLVVANNVVRRGGDQDAMQLFVGDGGRATVIGNLTSGPIQLDPGGLPPAMVPLNLLAP
jgi:hypothetical protein